MSTRKLSNIPVKEFRRFLESQGLNIIKDGKGRGGHEKWSKSGMDRPITIQSHIDPVWQRLRLRSRLRLRKKQRSSQEFMQCSSSTSNLTST